MVFIFFSDLSFYKLGRHSILRVFANLGVQMKINKFNKIKTDR